MRRARYQSHIGPSPMTSPATCYKDVHRLHATRMYTGYMLQGCTPATCYKDVHRLHATKSLLPPATPPPPPFWPSRRQRSSTTRAAPPPLQGDRAAPPPPLLLPLQPLNHQGDRAAPSRSSACADPCAQCCNTRWHDAWRHSAA